MSEPLYRVAKWETTFERAETRKVKTLHWVALPIGTQSTGYQQMIDDFGDQAPAIYGAWCALVSLAASCATRGTLGNGRGIPLKVSHIARMTMFPEQIFHKLIPWAASESVQWLEVVDPKESTKNHAKHEENETTGESPDDFPARQENHPTTGQDITGQDKTSAAACSKPAAAAAEGFFDGLDLQSVGLKAAKMLGAVPQHQRRELRDYIWEVCAIAEVIDPGLSGDLVVRLKSGKVESPKLYLDGAMRRECERLGGDFKDLRTRCPPAPPVKERHETPSR